MTKDVKDLTIRQNLAEKGLDGMCWTAELLDELTLAAAEVARLRSLLERGAQDPERAAVRDIRLATERVLVGIRSADEMIHHLAGILGVEETAGE